MGEGEEAHTGSRELEARDSEESEQVKGTRSSLLLHCLVQKLVGKEMRVGEIVLWRGRRQC